MATKQALVIAKRIADGTAMVAPHRGATRDDQGIRIWGCDATAAIDIGSRIAAAVGGELRVAAGFVCVWL